MVQSSFCVKNVGYALRARPGAFELVLPPLYTQNRPDSPGNTRALKPSFLMDSAALVAPDLVALQVVRVYRLFTPPTFTVMVAFDALLFVPVLRLDAPAFFRTGIKKLILVVNGACQLFIITQ
jgi:hypothetical protein